MNTVTVDKNGNLIILAIQLAIKTLSLSLSLFFSLSLYIYQAQNQWLRQNVIDVHGNFLFCRDCLVACLDVHTTHLQHQRLIKQKQKDQPVIQMTKQDVVEKRLEKFVLHDVEDDMLMFEAWWKTVEDDEVLEVQYPHEHHGLASRPYNHAKKEGMMDFLEFVDSNTQPNGRQAGSHSAQYFFIPKFTHIAAPRKITMKNVISGVTV